MRQKLWSIKIKLFRHKKFEKIPTESKVTANFSQNYYCWGKMDLVLDSVGIFSNFLCLNNFIFDASQFLSHKVIHQMALCWLDWKPCLLKQTFVYIFPKSKNNEANEIFLSPCEVSKVKFNCEIPNPIVHLSSGLGE